MAPPVDGDSFFEARVRWAEGTLKKRFSFVSNEVDQRRRCAFDARWNVRRSRVTIMVPQRCVRAFGGGTLHMGSYTSLAGERDRGPVARRVPRG